LRHSESLRQAPQLSTEARGVSVHVSVAGSQLSGPQALASVSGVHAAHVALASSQTGVPVRCVQSASDRHPAHALLAPSHREADASLQSAASSHPTHAPSTHARSGAVQSEARRQLTHAPVAASQSGVAPLHTPHGPASLPPSLPPSRPPSSATHMLPSHRRPAPHASDSGTHAVPSQS
jgi:hypothetical protein